jgi:transcriptional regulator GlxA family with amidase domain
MATDQKATQRFGFVLTRNFPLMSYASAIEPLRSANLLSGLTLYETQPLSIDGAPVRCSAGIAVECRSLLDHGQHCHTVFVCAGGHPDDWVASAGLAAALRQLSRQGIRLGAISSGAYILAAAGLLDSHEFTIHWEHAPLLRETFPHLLPRQARYVLAGDRLTCAGGIAPLDMMHSIIAERMGSHFARRVSDRNLHTTVAEPGAPQKSSAAERFGTNHAALLLILEKMEATVESPLHRASMAALAGISERHLDRLFATHLGDGFLRTYLRIRLEHARRLLEQSPLSIAEIAYAVGFSSSAHFTRSFTAMLGRTPRQTRQNTSTKPRDAM